MSPEPMIVQQDDCAIYHRRRWERTERSETTSAPRTVSNARTDAIGDAVMISRGMTYPQRPLCRNDDCAIYHRRRWERTERSETTSAPRTVSNARTDAIGD